jgi:SEC-C motif domain protein
MKCCPCGSVREYLQCCGLLIKKKQKALTPEALMRSRYTAFVEGDCDYLNKSMRFVPRIKKKAIDKRRRWMKLQVMASRIDHHNPDKGYVSFKAFFQEGNKDTECLEEHSVFHRMDGIWYYTGFEETR